MIIRFKRLGNFIVCDLRYRRIWISEFVVFLNIFFEICFYLEARNRMWLNFNRFTLKQKRIITNYKYLTIKEMDSFGIKKYNIREYAN